MADEFDGFARRLPAEAIIGDLVARFAALPGRMSLEQVIADALAVIGIDVDERAELTTALADALRASGEVLTRDDLQQVGWQFGDVLYADDEKPYAGVPVFRVR